MNNSDDILKLKMYFRYILYIDYAKKFIEK